MVLWRPTRPLELTPKSCCICHRGLECKSRKWRDTWSNRQVWAWSTKWSREKSNRVLPRELTGHNKHPLPTTQKKTLHMDAAWHVAVHGAANSQTWLSNWAELTDIHKTAFKTIAQRSRSQAQFRGPSRLRRQRANCRRQKHLDCSKQEQRGRGNRLPWVGD